FPLLPLALSVHHGERPSRPLRLFHVARRPDPGRDLGATRLRGDDGVRQRCELRRRSPALLRRARDAHDRLPPTHRRRLECRDIVTALSAAPWREPTFATGARSPLAASVWPASCPWRDPLPPTRASRGLRPRAHRPYTRGGARRSSSGAAP